MIELKKIFITLTLLILAILFMLVFKFVYIKKRYGVMADETIKNDTIRLVSGTLIILGFVLGVLLAWKVFGI